MHLPHGADCRLATDRITRAVRTRVCHASERRIGRRHAVFDLRAEDIVANVCPPFRVTSRAPPRGWAHNTGARGDWGIRCGPRPRPWQD